MTLEFREFHNGNGVKVRDRIIYINALYINYSTPTFTNCFTLTSNYIKLFVLCTQIFLIYLLGYNIQALDSNHNFSTLFLKLYHSTQACSY